MRAPIARCINGHGEHGEKLRPMLVNTLIVGYFMLRQCRPELAQERAHWVRRGVVGCWRRYRAYQRVSTSSWTQGAGLSKFRSPFRPPLVHFPPRPERFQFSPEPRR